jgi:hypothetical protein
VEGEAPVTPAVAGLTVGGDAGAWTAAGFTVVDDHIAMGTVDVRLTGEAEGVTAWWMTEVDDGVLDGITTFRGTPVTGGEHPNTTTSIDHVVVFTPDLDRTTEALGAFGIELRRSRDIGTRQQRFFRAGEVILEVIGAPGEHGAGPAAIWGLALTVADLDAAADLLGERLGSISDAVQPGRRIATLRHEAVGLHLPVALMTAPPPRGAA